MGAVWRRTARRPLRALPALPVLRLGEGLCFRKYFEKFAGLARREKFPEICSDRHDMGTSDRTPSKWSQTHSRPPETASRRHDPYKFYSILKGITLEVHQGPEYGAESALYEAISVKTEAYVVVSKSHSRYIIVCTTSDGILPEGRRNF